ncbi:wax ester/triacylglycerol synthase family O-acyltransferase [Nonomuraea phyllanthi]|uniref:Diacylglycerol O-acyltransferase n=1 Tax=Nonomuraea phyllanthi TaxID=2219224 RepID=A0A5C4W4Q8_9ACTN|nr:wax ester/triacylglycerol synthase family O-acyltransferase [Nonomuraea phyllanthi]KAB8191956.1 wax ester/triacylglycerol synthase family O-acyltransferase [Nonomuraea phyllanthi]QFY09960.1 wax ester/triacylglycerol synthase family O-acyltransferase [Nonomuraea phyllanthi]
MRQLSALDAQFLNFETATNIANVGGLALLGKDLSREKIQRRLAERMAVVPQLRQRLVRVPLGLDHPYWADDSEIDLGHHVRELTLPPPGDDRQLGEQVARLHEQRLDRSRPLWEMHLIHGLAGGGCGIYAKVHHAAVDGLTGAEVLAALMDPVPQPAEHEPVAAPNLWHMLARSVWHLAGNPLHLLRFVGEALPVLDQLPVISRLPGAGGLSRLVRRGDLPEAPDSAAPRTPLNGPISPHRSYAFVELPLREIKRVKNAYGVTVNDVVMTLAASALRRWLVAHAVLPEAPLVAGVPFSIRGREGANGGNQVTMMITRLPTQVADARRRLELVSEAMRQIKERFALTPARLLRDLSGSMPAALNGLADRAAMELMGRTPPLNVVVSNVPGPQFPLRIAGARLLAHYPVSVVTDVSGAVNLTAFSYNGRLDVGITACQDLVPDVWAFPAYLREALDELDPGPGRRKAPPRLG